MGISSLTIYVQIRIYDVLKMSREDKIRFLITPGKSVDRIETHGV